MAHILVLEDSAEMAFELIDRFESQGHHVSWCRSATEALEVLNAAITDLVIADIYIVRDGQLITDGGISLIGAMRMSEFATGKKDLSRIPVIAISGAVRSHGTAHILQVAETVGAHYTMAKPLILEDLDKMISYCLQTGAAALPQDPKEDTADAQ